MEKDVQSTLNGLLMLIKEVDSGAQRAYWSNHNDCGSDWSPDTCQPCSSYEQCKGQFKITGLIKCLDIMLSK